MREGQPDPFVVVGSDSLSGLSPASVGRVRAFYENWSPLEFSELQALSAAGMDLLKDRGRWLAWSSEERYESITVLPRRVGPSELWEEAVAEARESLERLAATSHEEHRRLLVEEQGARDAHRAAERNARAKGRLWGRWTDGHKEARGQVASSKVTHEEARDRAAHAGQKEQAAKWLADHLDERTQIAANVMSRRWTGWSCVGRWEDEVSSSDVQKIAAARVIGQATIGLMLSELISDDMYGRLLEPWRTSVSRVPRPLDDPPAVGDHDGSPDSRLEAAPAPEDSQDGRDREPRVRKRRLKGPDPLDAELVAAVLARPRGSTARPTRTAPTLKEWRLADHVEYSIDGYRRLAEGVLGYREPTYPISRAQANAEYLRVRNAQAQRRERHEAALQAGEFDQLLFTPEEEREHLLDLVGRLTPRVEASERLDAQDPMIMQRDEAAFVARAMGSIARLSSREQYVLAMRFGLESGTGYTLEETGVGLGMTRDLITSRERVRQIEAKALRKLRHPALRAAFVEDGGPDGE